MNKYVWCNERNINIIKRVDWNYLQKVTKSFGLHRKQYFDDGMYFTVDSLIEISNTITGLNSITLRKNNVNSYGSDKVYTDKELIEDKLYQIIDRFNERKLHLPSFILFSKIHLFYDGNRRLCKILLPNDDIMRQNI